MSKKTGRRSQVAKSKGKVRGRRPAPGTTPPLTELPLAKRVAEIAEAKKAEHISIIDISKLGGFTDCFVILTGTSSVHLRALVDYISAGLTQDGLRVPKWEGDLASKWIALDLGSVVVHLFGKQERAYYNIEGFWEGRGVTYHF